MTVKNWGETSLGNWTVSVRDGMSLDTGTFQNWTLNVFGTPVPEPASAFAFIGGLTLLLRRRSFGSCR